MLSFGGEVKQYQVIIDPDALVNYELSLSDVFEADMDVLKETAAEVRRVLATVPGTADLAVEQVAGVKYLQISIDRTRIARYGINVADLQDVIETAIGGKEAGEVFEGQQRFAIQVRSEAHSREHIDRIRDILVAAPNGQRVPMAQLADFTVEEGAAVANSSATKSAARSMFSENSLRPPMSSAARVETTRSTSARSRMAERNQRQGRVRRERNGDSFSDLSWQGGWRPGD